MTPVRMAAFASGSGTNVQALIDQEETLGRRYTVALVVSNRSDAGVLERARQADRPSVVIPTRDRTPAEVAEDTMAALIEHGIEAVLLAGYLRLLPEPVTHHFAGRILNIHPALLPAFGGKGMYGIRPHEAVLASGASFTGPTVHQVTAVYDEGSIVAQWPVPVLGDDTAQSLQSRVLRAEHRLYPVVAAHLADCVRSGRALSPMRLAAEAFRPGPWLPEDVSLGPE